MAELAELGSWRPTLITLTITAILSLWALYAASGAGIMVKLPLLRPVLCAITSVYLLRGLAGFALISPLGRSPAFWLWSSAICLAIGAVHFIGVVQSWEHLSRKQPNHRFKPSLPCRRSGGRRLKRGYSESLMRETLRVIWLLSVRAPRRTSQFHHRRKRNDPRGNRSLGQQRQLNFASEPNGCSKSKF